MLLKYFAYKSSACFVWAFFKNVFFKSGLPSEETMWCVRIYESECYIVVLIITVKLKKMMVIMDHSYKCSQGRSHQSQN